MSRTQRTALVAAALVVLVAGFFVLRPSDNDPTPTADTTAQTVDAAAPPASTQATDTVEQATTRTTTLKPEAQPKAPLLTTAKVTEIEVEKGDTVRFRAVSSAGDEVHVHGYDISKDAPAGKTISMSFKADLEGIFEIEFEHSGTEIGRLKVTP